MVAREDPSGFRHQEGQQVELSHGQRHNFAVAFDAPILQANVDRLRRDVESVAVSRFISSGSTGIPLLTGLQAPQDQLQAEVFVQVLTTSGSELLDTYDIAEKRLLSSEADLADRRRDIEAQQEVFVALQQQAEDEVVRLRAIEEVRLQDEAVQRALDARIAAQRVQLEEQARRGVDWSAWKVVSRV